MQEEARNKRQSVIFIDKRIKIRVVNKLIHVQFPHIKYTIQFSYNDILRHVIVKAKGEDWKKHALITATRWFCESECTLLYVVGVVSRI